MFCICIDLSEESRIEPFDLIFRNEDKPYEQSFLENDRICARLCRDSAKATLFYENFF